MTPVVEYFADFNAGNTTVNRGALEPISRKLDAATNVVIFRYMNILRSSPEHEARVRFLHRQPRTAGDFSQEKILFPNASAFEQMVAISDWLAQARIRENHTFFISAFDDDYVPVRANKIPQKPATMMHVVLGTTIGSHKSPKYENWAQSDPWLDPAQRVFIDALESLEIVRQPNYSAATMLKGNPFEHDLISTDWRYGKTFACVEDSGQSRYSPKKVKSAGLNACSLAEAFSNLFDPQAEGINICLPVHYEDYSNDQDHNRYADDLDITVSPGQIIKATQTATDGNWLELIRLVENLAIAKIGPPRTPVLCNYIASRIRANADPN